MTTRKTLLFELPVLAAFLFYFFEWLFFITKPSILSSTGWLGQIQVLLISFLPVAIIAGGIGLLAEVVARIRPKARKAMEYLALGVTASIGGCLLFMVLENFSYTLTKFHVGSLKSGWQFLYIPVFVWFVIYSFMSVGHYLRSDMEKLRRGIRLGTVALLVIALATLGLTAKVSDVEISGTQEELGELPNIVILSTDGLRTRNMSAYGYEKQTTPFIESIVPKSLIFENHFSNNTKTTGSVISMLTGRLPTTTRVVFRPDQLGGKDSFLHLPGILRKLGYHNGDFSVRHYVDAVDLNLQNGFHVANERIIPNKPMMGVPRSLQSSLGFPLSFVAEVHHRLSARLGHMMGISEYNNPFHEVMALNTTSRGTDFGRMEALKKFMAEAPRPFFTSVHLLGTHGPMFNAKSKIFSGHHTGKPKPWSVDHYNDSVRDYDDHVAEIYAHLESLGQIDNTILILSSDHGMAWSSSESIPLIIHYPRKGLSGRQTKTSQRLDIAPTILDLLGMEPPKWMEGVSLLGERRDERPIFAGDRIPSKNVKGWREVYDAKPPFYSLGSLSMIICNRYYHLILKNMKINYRSLKDRAEGCEGVSLPPKEEAKAMMLDKLEISGYAVGKFKKKSG